MEQKHVDLNTFQGVVLNLTRGWFTEMHRKYVEKWHCFHEFVHVATQVFQFF